MNSKFFKFETAKIGKLQIQVGVKLSFNNNKLLKIFRILFAFKENRKAKDVNKIADGNK